MSVCTYRCFNVLRCTAPHYGSRSWRTMTTRAICQLRCRERECLGGFLEVCRSQRRRRRKE